MKIVLIPDIVPLLFLIPWDTLMWVGWWASSFKVKEERELKAFLCLHARATFRAAFATLKLLEVTIFLLRKWAVSGASSTVNRQNCKLNKSLVVKRRLSTRNSMTNRKRQKNFLFDLYLNAFLVRCGLGFRMDEEMGSEKKQGKQQKRSTKQKWSH